MSLAFPSRHIFCNNITGHCFHFPYIVLDAFWYYLPGTNNNWNYLPILNFLAQSNNVVFKRVVTPFLLWPLTLLFVEERSIWHQYCINSAHMKQLARHCSIRLVILKYIVSYGIESPTGFYWSSTMLPSVIWVGTYGLISSRNSQCSTLDYS